MPWAPRQLAWCVVLLAVGCGDYPVPSPWHAGSESTSGASTSGHDSGSLVPRPPVSTSTGTLEDDDHGMVFLIAHDMPRHQCNVFDQDCPRGEKCTYFYLEGDAFWQARCVPIPAEPHQLGEPCAWTPQPEHGIDDCDAGLYCLGFTGLSFGTCVAFCLEGNECLPCQGCSFNHSFIPVCIPQCNPLDDACPVGSSCIYQYSVDFACGFDGGLPGEVGSVCDAPYGCHAGTWCVADEYVPGCIGSACCTALCSLSDPGACAAQPGTVCHEIAVSGANCPYFDDVGACVLPQP
jgi:hypothetical protein